MAESVTRHTAWIVGGAAAGAAVALSVFISTQLSGGLTAFVGAITAAGVLVVTVGLLAGHTIEWVIDKFPHRPRTRKPQRAMRIASGPCSMCGAPKTSSGTLWLCLECDARAPS